jgi:lysophospholipase L1-like esterase
MLVKLRRSIHKVVTAAFAAGVITVGLAVPATAAPAAKSSATVGNYLALGDSVAFGYIPPNASPPPNYNDPSSFVGYPEDLGRALRLKVANASCPGETTVSFIAQGGLSNGCENSPGSATGYRTFYPLHVNYPNTQLNYAENYLRGHSATSLVTIDIGANDGFICQETTKDGCTSPTEQAAVVKEVKVNLEEIVAALRTTGGYQGTIVALNYYALNYSVPQLVEFSRVINKAIGEAARAENIVVASGFNAFERASVRYGGDPCKAGLLIPLPTGGCNIHPSPEGHLLLAAAIARAIGK